MRIQDIIRSMIDMIDGAEQPAGQSTTTIIVAHPTATGLHGALINAMRGL